MNSPTDHHDVDDERYAGGWHEDVCPSCEVGLTDPGEHRHCDLDMPKFTLRGWFKSLFKPIPPVPGVTYGPYGADTPAGAKRAEREVRMRFDKPKGKSVALGDLGAAVTEAVVYAASGALTERETQQRIDAITNEHGVPLLLELIRFPATPSEFPPGACSKDFGVEHVARIINTLCDSGFELGRARLELATLCFNLFGWTVPEAARAVLEYAATLESALPHTPHSQAALFTAHQFSDDDLDAVMDRIERPRF